MARSRGRSGHGQGTPGERHWGRGYQTKVRTSAAPADKRPDKTGELTPLGSDKSDSFDSEVVFQPEDEVVLLHAVQGSMPQLANSAAQASVPAIQSTAPKLATSAGESIASGGGGLVDTLAQNPLNVLTSTPPGLTYANGVVQQLQGVTLAAAAAALALVIAWAGFQVIVHSSMGGLNFGEAFGRIVVGAALLVGVRIGTGWALEAMNHLSEAILTAPVVGGALPHITVDVLDGGAGLLLTIVGLLAAL